MAIIKKGNVQPSHSNNQHADNIAPEGGQSPSTQIPTVPNPHIRPSSQNSGNSRNTKNTNRS
jgi:hypothetical protein